MKMRLKSMNVRLDFQRNQRVLQPSKRRVRRSGGSGKKKKEPSSQNVQRFKYHENKEAEGDSKSENKQNLNKLVFDFIVLSNLFLQEKPAKPKWKSQRQKRQKREKHGFSPLPFLNLFLLHFKNEK